MKIILSIAVILFLVGCSEDSTKEVQKRPKQELVKKVKDTTPKVEKNVEEVKTVEIKQEEIKQKVIKKEVIEVAQPATEIVEEKLKHVNNGEKEIVSSAASTSDEGKKAYKACASCHGQNGEKAALGKSKVIKGWSADKTINALNGYKDGTYGGSMKALMKGQSQMLSDENAKLVAKYISTL